MNRDAATTERLRKLIEKLISLTAARTLHWERQVGSAHSYARWNNNLLILGPAASASANTHRYLFITPFDSPSCIEINTDDEQLGSKVHELVVQVEAATKDEPPIDPFAITDDLISSLTD